MNARFPHLLLAAALAWPATSFAQGSDVRARLAERGLPADLARDVAGIAAEAAARGLPGAAVADKAIEGWAKRVDARRILAAVSQYSVRLGEAQDALSAAGLAGARADVVVAAAEALGRGLGPRDVGAVVRAAGQPAALAPGLTVAAALTAQGLSNSQAVGVVTAAMRMGRPVDQMLDLPSLVRALRTEGVEPGEIGRRLMRGGAPPPPPGHSGAGSRPPDLPRGVPGGRGPGGQRPPGGE